MTIFVVKSKFEDVPGKGTSSCEVSINQNKTATLTLRTNINQDSEQVKVIELSEIMFDNLCYNVVRASSVGRAEEGLKPING